MFDTDTVIYVLALVMLFCGWLPTYIMYRREKARIERIHRFQLDQEFFKAFGSGWDAGYAAQQKEAAWNRLMERKQKFPNNR